MSLAFVFPGQGSQSVGMMSALAKMSPVIAATFAEASGVLGYDLWQRCQEGPPEALKLVSAPTPEPAAGEILIKVAFAGASFPDILQRKGLYPMPPGAPETMGLEVSGFVAAVGDDVDRWTVGDKVCALLMGAGYAEYVAVDARHVLPIPETLSLEQAAGLPETAFTVFSNVFERGRLRRGETFLVHGASGGIGTMAIGMAKAAGAKVIATARGEEKARQARALGADVSIDSSTEDFATAVAREGGADVVLDMVGGGFFQKNIDVLRPDGRLCQIAFVTGAEVGLSLVQLVLKRLTVTGSSIRARSADEKARLTAEVEAHVLPWIVSGQLRVHVDRVFGFADVSKAHAYLESGGHFGKVILRV